MKVSKAVCTVGSGLGSIMMIGAGIGAFFGIFWLGANYISKNVGDFIGAYIIIPIICVILFIFFASGWWALSKWLWGHCQDYWSTK